MKKILCISNLRMDNGGVEKLIMGLYRESNRDLLKFDFLVDASQKGYYDDEILSNGDRLLYARYRFNKKIPKIISLFIQNLTFFIDLLRILKEEGPYDVVHCHSLRLNGISMLAAKIRKVPIRITHSHIAPVNINNHFSYYGLVNFRFSQLLIQLFANVKLGCSKEANEFLYGKRRAFNNDSVVINNGIDLSEFSPNNSIDIKEIKEMYGVSENTKLFLNVGRYTKQKNQKFIIQVARELLASGIDCFIFFIVGYGELEQELKKDIAKFKLQRHIKLMPQDSHISMLCHISDLFVLPSLYEGLGIVLIEAQAMNLQCIASDYVPEEVNLGLCEFLSVSKKQDAKIWAEKIVEYINSHNIATLNKTLLSNYDIKSVYKEVEKIYLSN